MVKNELFVLILLLPLLTACGGELGTSNQPEATFQASPQGAVQPISPTPAATSAGNESMSGNVQPQAKPAFRRGGLLRSTQPAEEQAPPDPYLAQYDKARLDKAAAIHSWRNIPMTDGVEATIWTRWARGVINVRAAVVGPRDQIAHFRDAHESLIVHLQDSTCNSLKMATVPLNTLKEESPGAKREITRFISEGQLACTLEDYERIKQWTVEWN